MNIMLASLKKFNWKLFIALILLSLVPAIYQTVITFLISSVPSTSAFDVIGQMEWFDLIDETLQAFLIIPLYFVLNRFVDNKKEFGKNVFKVGMITFTLYFIFSIGVFVYATHLVELMSANENDIPAITTYLRFETISFVIGILVSYAMVVFVVMGNTKNFYVFLIVKALATTFVDLYLIPKFGVNGVAFGNITINLALTIAVVFVLRRENALEISWFSKKDIDLMKTWAKVGIFSGGQVFIDNIIYALMIGKMVNEVAEQGNYWNANNFIWGWLLIPIYAMSSIIRHDCKDGYKALNQKNYYYITGMVIVILALSIPLWTWFYSSVEGLDNASRIFDITLKLFPFYIAYAFTMIIDNIFYGLGKTTYNLVNSLIINLGYYGIFFILFVSNKITMSMDVIILMFGFGMVVHWLISIVQERFFLRKKYI